IRDLARVVLSECRLFRYFVAGTATNPHAGRSVGPSPSTTDARRDLFPGIFFRACGADLSADLYSASVVVQHMASATTETDVLDGVLRGSGFRCADGDVSEDPLSGSGLLVGIYLDAAR